MLKQIGRSRPFQAALFFLAVRYLKLLRATTRFMADPPDFAERVLGDAPVIAALWHGQHTMANFAWPRGLQVAALISRNADAEVNARVLEAFGVTPIRGSGGRAGKMHQRGGFAAMRDMLRTLDEGTSVVLTADVPKVARVCGEGIIRLAMLSGRPVYPLAVVKKWRWDFSSWDRASLGLPFGQGAIVVGEPIHIERGADAGAVERARRQLERSLNEIHARAYALVGSSDPGAAIASTADTHPARAGSASP